MDTPILDFLRQYSEHDWVRFHMPGHKGKGMLGCEKWDITEVYGADALYEADGIIAKSERNAAELFGTQRTCYSTGNAVSRPQQQAEGQFKCDSGCPQCAQDLCICRGSP